MKYFYLFIIMFAFYIAGRGQVNTTNYTVTIKPDKDALVTNGAATTNYGNYTLFKTFAGSAYGQGIPNLYYRSLIEFNLSAIPQNAVIKSAVLTLYGIDHEQLTQPNASYLQRVSASWSESTVTWNNQPASVTDNRIALPSSTSATQNYTVDVSYFVQNWVNGTFANYGFLFKLQNEVKYTSMSFGSSDYSDTTKRPVLVITYSTPGTITDYYPSNDSYVNNILTTNNYGLEDNINAAFLSRSIGYFRGLIGFNISNILTSAVVNSASLKLTGKEFSGTNNAVYLRKVTSSWAECGVTWNNQPTTTTTGQISLAHSGSLIDNTVDVTSFAQSWVTTPASNYGLQMILQTESTSNVSKRSYYSKDDLTVSKRPVLTVNYTEKANTACDAIGIPYGPNCFYLTDTVLWLKFVAEHKNYSISLGKMNSNVTPVVTSAAFYSGDCSSLTLMKSLNISVFNDSIFLTDTNFVEGDLYFVKIKRSVNTVVSKNYVNIQLEGYTPVLLSTQSFSSCENALANYNTTFNIDQAFSTDYTFRPGTLIGSVPQGQPTDNGAVAIHTTQETLTNTTWQLPAGCGNVLICDDFWNDNGVNTIPDPRRVWYATNVPVLANTHYVFRFKAKNLSNDLDNPNDWYPNLQFWIEDNNGNNAQIFENNGASTITLQPGSNFTTYYGYWYSGTNTSVSVDLRSVGTPRNYISGRDFAIDDIELFVNLPDVSFNPYSICSGDPAVTLQPVFTNNNDNSGQYEYTWYNNAQTQTITVNPTTSQLSAVFPYNLTIKNTLPTCTLNLTANVTVYGKPDFTLQNTMYCPPSPAPQLQPMNLVPSDPTPYQMTYAWSPGTGLSSTSIPNPIASPSIGTTYTLAVTNHLAHCKKTATTSVGVANTPLAAITYTTLNVCNGGSVTLTASAGYSYQWQKYNPNPPPYGQWENIPGATGQTYVTSTAGSYLVVVTLNGCSATSNVAVVQVLPYDYPPASITAASNPACLPSVLTANSGSGYMYQWYLDGVAVSGANSVTYSPQQVGNYIVKVTSNGCATLSDPIAAIQGPIISAGADQCIAPGESAQLEVTGFPVNSGIQWSPTGTLSCTTCANPVATPTATTIYTATITTPVGCVVSDDVKVTLSTWAKFPVGSGMEDNIGVEMYDGVYAAGNIRKAGLQLEPGIYIDNTYNCYVVKYDFCGEVLWWKGIQADVTSDVILTNIAMGHNEVLIAGNYNGYVNFGNNKTLTTSVARAFIASYNLFGDCQWAIDLTGNVDIKDISTYKNGDITSTYNYVLGEYSSATAGCGSFSVSNTGGSNNTKDVFLLKIYGGYTVDILGMTNIDGCTNAPDYGYSLDASTYHLYIGVRVGNVDKIQVWNPSNLSYISSSWVNAKVSDIAMGLVGGNEKIYWTGTTDAGEMRYGAKIGASFPYAIWDPIPPIDITGNGEAKKISYDDNGNFFVVGHFWSPSLQIQNDINSGLSKNSSQDLFLYKLNSGGGYLWGGRYGETGYNYLNGFANHNDLMFITGWYTGYLLFNNYATATGVGDIYVARIRDEGTYPQAFRYVNNEEQNEEYIPVEPIAPALIAENNYKVYPVPANKMLNVEISLAELCNEASIDLFDLAGKKVASVTKTSILNEKVSIDVASLPDGIYLCRINTGNDMVSYKIIIQK